MSRNTTLNAKLAEANDYERIVSRVDRPYMSHGTLCKWADTARTYGKVAKVAPFLIQQSYTNIVEAGLTDSIYTVY